MQLKPGDIAACTWASMWDDETVKRSRFIVLEVFENNDYYPHMDDEDDGDWFLDIDYIRAYCYDFEGCAEAIDTIFNLPGDFMVRIG